MTEEGACHFNNGTISPFYDTEGYNYSVCSNGSIYVPAAPLAPSAYKHCQFSNGSFGPIYDTTGFSDTICFLGVVLVEAKQVKKSELTTLQLSFSLLVICLMVMLSNI